MTVFLCLLSLAGGYAFCWFTKDSTVAVFTGAEALAAKLEAKAKAWRSAS